MPENAEIYTNSQLALALFEVLEEMIADGTVPEELAYGLLAQVSLAARSSRCPSVSSIVIELTALTAPCDIYLQASILLADSLPLPAKSDKKQGSCVTVEVQHLLQTLHSARSDALGAL